MNVRWRLSVLGLQLLILATVSYLVTGQLYATGTWYFAVLLAIAINPQLLEPYYSRPSDVVANSIIFILLATTTPHAKTQAGWLFVGTGVVIAMLLSIIALVLGAGRRAGKFIGIASGAKSLSQVATSKVIYSAVFLLSAIETYPSLNRNFWILLIGWAVILILGGINWQAVWTSSRGREEYCIVEGMIGPSILLVSAPNLPPPGKTVALKASKLEVFGVIVNRIRRVNDIWGQIHVDNREYCESILTGQNLLIYPQENCSSNASKLVGSVDQGSTDKILRFLALRPLEIGQVIGVPVADADSKPCILYQLSSALVERTEIKGGAHLVVRATGNQLGTFDESTLRFKQHRWVPTPGGPIYSPESLKKCDIREEFGDVLKIGHVIGTDIPIFLDQMAACEGHVAILGMTKMGKSTLATRIAHELARTRRVTILDQTGEYVSKKGFTPCDKNIDWNSPGVSVFEPKPGEVAADRALEFFNFLVKKAVEEYKTGTPYPRVVIIDEAHQFIPEPAGLGFQAPGRDSSFKIGLLLMQVRKYGISVYLISQRTAVVAKSALSQCENLIAFRSVDQTGLDYLEAIAGADIRSLLPQLRQREALVFGPAMSAEGAVAIEVMNQEDEIKSNSKKVQS